MKHKFGKLRIAGATVLLLVVASLGLGSTPALAAGNTCTWIGSATGSWNTSSNWSGCGGTVPHNGDSLAFNSTGLTSIFLNNNISNLQLNSITFTGTSIYPFDITGNAISLSGGITDTTQVGAGLSTDITLTADQTFSSSALLDLDGSNLFIGNHNLNANGVSGGEIDIFSSLTGSGNLTFNGDSSGLNFINSDNPSFSGPIHIASGTLVINAAQTDQLGSGSVTIDDGATLQESINNNGSYTIANPITLEGNGEGFWSAGAIVVYGYSSFGTVNFTGPFTLTGAATIGLTSADASISGSVSGCGFNMSLASGTTGTLSGNLTGSCPVPATNSGNSGAATSSTTSKISAPDTGSGQPNSVPARADMILLIVAGIGISLTSGLYLLRCD